MAASPAWQTRGQKSESLGHKKTPGSTLFDVELPGLVSIQGIESFVEARRVQQELQVFFAAVLQEINNFFVFLYGFDNLRLFECPGVVLIDPAREPGGGRRDASTAYEPRRRRDARKLEVE